jgi:hypothetical protein
MHPIFSSLGQADGNPTPASATAARAPRAATRLPRRRAWLRIFVVRCGLPCGAALLDHLVGGNEQLVGHGDLKRLGSLEINHEPEGDWLLDW